MTKRTILRDCLAALLGAFTGAAAHSAEAPIRLVVRADQAGPRISPTMYGVFFEDINCGADGGLYAEKVKNRSFEFPDGLMGWSEVKKGAARGSLAILDQEPLSAANPHYLRIQAEAAGDGYGAMNEGFFGMGVREGEEYLFSAYIRGRETEKAALVIELIAPDGRSIAKTGLPGLDARPSYVLPKGFEARWKNLSATLQATVTEPHARLQLTLRRPGRVDLDMVSLFPANTWRNRPNGLRADLVQWLADLKPGFVRFPGGCIVEGRRLDTRYQWKTTIGKPEERRLIINRWNIEFKHRPAPDYFQSFGLGFYEYFLLCEDVGAEPLPILNCGMACQFNSGELAPLDALDPYIQDALDLIEFANGPAASEWGRRRAGMGHPEPFDMKLLGVGNEQWGPQYIERYDRFAKVLKAKHPEIALISSAGPSPDDDRFRFLWTQLRERNADIVDEHCYARPDWFFDNAHRYDKYDRNGPKVFMGEYAAQSVKVGSPENRNNLECALSEAAFMTGLERNADVVTMSSYAPLFAHEDGWQWRPNLIWLDNLQSYGTPSYYVQQMFGANRGDVLLPIELNGQEPPSSKQPGLYACASREEKSGEIILKIVNSAAEPRTAIVQIDGVKQLAPQGAMIVLTGKPADENSIAEPKKVSPATSTLEGVSAKFKHTFPPHSLTVLRMKIKE